MYALVCPMIMESVFVFLTCYVGSFSLSLIWYQYYIWWRKHDIYEDAYRDWLYDANNAPNVSNTDMYDESDENCERF